MGNFAYRQSLKSLIPNGLSPTSAMSGTGDNLFL